MSRTTLISLLVLEAGLFPDAATLEAALHRVPENCAIHRRQIKSAEMNNAAWDRLLGEILAAKTILTL